MSAMNVAIHKAYLLSCVNSRLQDLEAAAAVLRGRKIATTVKFYVAAASAEVQKAAEASGAWHRRATYPGSNLGWIQRRFP